jgi:hypothetical protein
MRAIEGKNSRKLTKKERKKGEKRKRMENGKYETTLIFTYFCTKTPEQLK